MRGHGNTALKGLGCLILAWAGCAVTLGAEDLAPNPSFEKTVDEKGCSWPAGWIPSPRGATIAVVTNGARTETHCVRMTALGRKGGHQSLLVALPAKPGAKYSFGLYARNDESDRLAEGSSGVLTVEFFDDQDLEIGRVSSEPWDANLSRLRWTHAEIKQAKAPKNTVSVKFVIHFCELERPGHGSFLIDDVSIMQE